MKLNNFPYDDYNADPRSSEEEKNLNSVATQLRNWFRQNGLILNLTKTQFIAFDLSGRKRRPLVVDVEGVDIKQTNQTSFLGFQIDKTLSWESHIETLCGKLGSACFALYRLASTLPPNVVKSCYFATVQSLLQYGLEFWGRAAEWERVFRMQKRAVRAIVRAPQDDSAQPIFQNLGIMTLPSLLIYQVAIYARTNLSLYGRRGDNQHHNLRNARQLSSIPHTLEKARRTIHAMGPPVYNKLPTDIQDAPSLNTFKSKLKKWLVSKAFYSFKQFIELKH
ncbi:hypothetical protein NE865_02080 [Phthorimaea operculella]|nr:hypothetical protein NE865_02080 [Phthorimaea operculella]